MIIFNLKSRLLKSIHSLPFDFCPLHIHLQTKDIAGKNSQIIVIYSFFFIDDMARKFEQGYNDNSLWIVVEKAHNAGVMIIKRERDEFVFIDFVNEKITSPGFGFAEYFYILAFFCGSWINYLPDIGQEHHCQLKGQLIGLLFVWRVPSKCKVFPRFHLKGKGLKCIVFGLFIIIVEGLLLLNPFRHLIQISLYLFVLYVFPLVEVFLDRQEITLITELLCKDTGRDYGDVEEDIFDHWIKYKNF